MALDNLESYQENNMFNLEEYTGELSSLKDEVINGSRENEEYDKYPYINEQDYKKYFAPETYNFEQYNIGACRFVASIYGITQMESYKSLIKNSVKKDGNGNFIIKVPLSTEKTGVGVWHKIDISAYENQRTIDGSNPQILKHKEGSASSGSGIIALAMAIGEEIVGKPHFDIHRLDGGYTYEIFGHGKAISGIDLEEVLEPSEMTINRLKELLQQEDTIVYACVYADDYGGKFYDYSYGGAGNHYITITKIINGDVRYYDPNFFELHIMSVDNLLKKCYEYEIYGRTNKEDYSVNILDRENPYQDKINKNSAGMVVENTKKRNDTLRNLRGDFITYQEDNITVVESRGKRAEIINDVPPMGYHMTVSTGSGKIIGEDSGEFVTVGIYHENSYRCINFSNSNARLYVDTSKLSNKYKGKKNEQYREHLYLPKIANFMNRMIYNYIDTESRNIENPSPFSVNELGYLVFDDNPYDVNFDKIENSERGNMKREWEERKKEKQKSWNHKLVCLRDRSKLGINDKKTKQAIVDALNRIIYEQLSSKWVKYNERVKNYNEGIKNTELKL